MSRRQLSRQGAFVLIPLGAEMARKFCKLSIIIVVIIIITVIITIIIIIIEVISAMRNRDKIQII